MSLTIRSRPRLRVAAGDIGTREAVRDAIASFIRGTGGLQRICVVNAAAYAVGERAQGYEEGFLYMIGHIAVAYVQHGQDLPVIPVDEGNESVGYYQSFSERWRADPRSRIAVSKRVYEADQPLVEAVCLDAQPDTDLAEPFSTGMYDAYLICAEAAHLRQANSRLLEQTGS